MTLEDSQYKKSLTKEILKIGVPSFLETLFTTFVSVIDSKMVSALGVTAISAVSVTNQPRLFVYSIFFAMNTVTTSLVAKYHGKGDQETANRVFDHTIKIIVVLSIVLGLLAAALARPIMILFSGQADTLEASITYFRIVMAGMIFNLVFLEVNAALRGFGKTNLTFIDNVLACAVNILFNWLLIMGHWGFPALGIAGAAFATVLGNAAAFVLSIVFVCSRKLFINIPYCISKRFHMTKESLREITAQTKSCAVDNLAMRATLLVISGITARIGSFQMAIYSIGNYLLNVNFALGTGLQTSSVTLIGRSYGEGVYDRLKAYRMLGGCPYPLLEERMEFSPIDQTARAVVLLAGTPAANVVFHVQNDHMLPMDDILSRLHKDDGSPLDYLEVDEFVRRMDEAKADPEKARILSSIIAYTQAEGQVQMVENVASSVFSMQVLHRLGFRWDETSSAYVDMIFRILDSFRFFDD